MHPLLDRISILAGENMYLKRYVAEKNKRIEELEAKLCAEEPSAPSTAAAASTAAVVFTAVAASRPVAD